MTMARRVLVIEDNPVTRRMIRVALEAEGYGVSEARDGATALEQARLALPDLVLQDLLLPGTDALDLLRALRALPGGERLPVLVCSGSLSRVEEARKQEVGFSGFLYKPVEPSRLVEVIHRHLGGAGA